MVTRWPKPASCARYPTSVENSSALGRESKVLDGGRRNGDRSIEFIGGLMHDLRRRVGITHPPLKELTSAGHRLGCLDDNDLDLVLSDPVRCAVTGRPVDPFEARDCEVPAHLLLCGAPRIRDLAVVATQFRTIRQRPATSDPATDDDRRKRARCAIYALLSKAGSYDSWFMRSMTVVIPSRPMVSRRIFANNSM
jgi:hypothetical protein